MLESLVVIFKYVGNISGSTRVKALFIQVSDLGGNVPARYALRYKLERATSFQMTRKQPS